jgi:protoheme IX farnesyltransferase
VKKQNSHHTIEVSGERSFLTDLKLLFKLRLSHLVVFSSIVAYCLAADRLRYEGVIMLALGGYFVTWAANALNQVLERDYDKLMNRTMNRPLPMGSMTVSGAVLSAGLLSLMGISILALFDPLTALLGTLSLISYSFIYTPMKRVSPVAVIIGAIPGALPTLIGCVAAEGGKLTSLGLALFAIQFFWQFPHFWAIAWLGHEDYSRAGFRLLPSKNGEPNSEVGFQAFLYSLALLPISVIPYLVGATGLLSLVIVTIVNLVYIFASWQFYRKDNREVARKLMFASFFHLPVVLLTFLADKI